MLKIKLKHIVTSACIVGTVYVIYEVGHTIYKYKKGVYDDAPIEDEIVTIKDPDEYGKTLEDSAKELTKDIVVETRSNDDPIDEVMDKAARRAAMKNKLNILYHEDESKDIQVDFGKDMSYQNAFKEFMKGADENGERIEEGAKLITTPRPPYYDEARETKIGEEIAKLQINRNRDTETDVFSYFVDFQLQDVPRERRILYGLMGFLFTINLNEQQIAKMLDGPDQQIHDNIIAERKQFFNSYGTTDLTYQLSAAEVLLYLANQINWDYGKPVDDELETMLMHLDVLRSYSNKDYQSVRDIIGNLLDYSDNGTHLFGEDITAGIPFMDQLYAYYDSIHEDNDDFDEEDY